ncbi:hypothetical protein CEP53_008210 [Fusarium sp. AF-6]|nr:hypothetical protein CEP53_008210 [Fusarium sp. AF-6]
MSAPPTAQEATNDQPCSTCTEQPQFSNRYLERVLAALLEEVRMLKAAVTELGLRLPAAVELEEYEFVDFRYMLKLDSDIKLVNRLGIHGILDALHKLGGCYLQIESIRYIPKSSSPILGPDGETISERTPSLVFVVKTYQAEYEIRNSSSKIDHLRTKAPRCSVTNVTRPVTSRKSVDSPSSDADVAQDSIALPVAAPKNPPGRPSKFATASRDPRQQSILQYQVKVADSTATATKQSATELTPDTLGDTTMVETESDDSPEGMMDTETAASDESAAAQGHHGNGDPVAAVQPTMETDTDMADYTMTDFQGVAESQVPVSGSGSDTASAEKKKKKNQSWAKKKGKKAASTRDEAQEPAEGSGGTKSQEKTTSEVKVPKDQAHCSENNNENKNVKKKTKEGKGKGKGKGKNKDDAKQQGAGPATSQGNNTGCNGKPGANVDSSNGAKEVAQGTLAPSGKTGPQKGKRKGKGRGKGKGNGKAHNSAKSSEKDVEMGSDTMMDLGD